MKRVLLLLVAMATLASANSFIVGVDAQRNFAKDEVSTPNHDISLNHKSVTARLKAGYQMDYFRGLVYIQKDRYTEDVLLEGEGDAKTYGVEVDFLIGAGKRIDLFIGATYGKGEKDMGYYGELLRYDKLDFTDRSIKGGVIFPFKSWQFETGLECKYRDYEKVTDGTYSITPEERIIGVFVGVNFSI